jgi:hypothetical protein
VDEAGKLMNDQQYAHLSAEHLTQPAERVVLQIRRSDAKHEEVA